MNDTHSAPEHLSGYQARDYDVVDYQMSCLPDTQLYFRGPLTDEATTSPAIVCLGAAQTFGCFTDAPFPSILQSALHVPVLNLGYGGAGPAFYARHPEVIEYANRAQLVVLQVMSGRSESNSRYASGGLEYLVRRSDGERLSAVDAYHEMLFGRHPSKTVSARVMRRALQPLRRARTGRVVEETRHNWQQSYHALFDAIKVPTVLLWFSRRAPDYVEGYGSVSQLFADYPQLVRREMVEQIARRASHYVECTTGAGLPQPLLSRFTGSPTVVDPAQDRPDLGGRVWTHNNYYPSPEMHQAAAAALLPGCQEILGRR